MNQIIKVIDRQIGDSAIQTVNARDLHAFLGLARDFNQWMREQIDRARLVDGRDYVSYEDVGNPSSGRPRKEFALSLESAKHIAMMSGSDKGFEVREYFIECERQAKTPALNPANLSRLQLIEMAMQAEQERLALENKVEILAPKAAALDLISASDESLTITQAAKVLSIRRDVLTNWLHANGWTYRQNGSWVAYQQHIQNGRLIYKEAHYTNEKTGQKECHPYCHITQKGLAKLAEVFVQKAA